MYKVAKQTLKKAYKPFDIVSTTNGDVGFISEVSVNDSQEEPEHQISYSVTWLYGAETITAWWDHDDLTYHCNFFVKVSEGLCHAFGGNDKSITKLFNNFNLK